MSKRTTNANFQPQVTVVLNFSGNVGKTTLSAHGLAPFLDARIFSVESLNSDASDDGFNVEGFDGARMFHNLQAEIQLLAIEERVVVDVGSSSVQVFLDGMNTHRGAHEDYGMFVVPCHPEQKAQIDTINTIKRLQQLGVPSQKIRVVLTKVPESADEHALRILFSFLFAYHDTTPAFLLSPFAAMHHYDLYEQIKGDLKQSVRDLAQDESDWRANALAAKAAGDMFLAQRYAERVGFRREAQSAQADLEACCLALFS